MRKILMPLAAVLLVLAIAAASAAIRENHSSRPSGGETGAETKESLPSEAPPETPEESTVPEESSSGEETDVPSSQAAESSATETETETDASAAETDPETEPAESPSETVPPTEPESSAAEPDTDFTVEPLSEIRYTLDDLSVRQYPRRTAERLTVFRSHLQIHITGRTESEGEVWYQVMVDGTPCYVNGGYVSEYDFYEEPYETSLYVNTDALNVRALPSGQIIGRLTMDDRVSICARTNTGWYKLTGGGYISSDYVSETRTIWYQPNQAYLNDMPRYVWDFLYTRLGQPYMVAAIMGSIACESGFNAINVQNTCKSYYWKRDFADPLHLVKPDGTEVKWSECSRYYDTGGLDSKTFINTYLTRKFDDLSYAFDYYGPDNKQFGYGLVQWTSNRRKLEFFNYAHQRYESIGNVDIQLDFILYELTNTYSSCMEKMLATEGWGSGQADDSNPVWIIERYYESPANAEAAFAERQAQAYYYFSLYYGG